MKRREIDLNQSRDRTWTNYVIDKFFNILSTHSIQIDFGEYTKGNTKYVHFIQSLILWKSKTKIFALANERKRNAEAAKAQSSAANLRSHFIWSCVEWIFFYFIHFYSLFFFSHFFLSLCLFACLSLFDRQTKHVIAADAIKCCQWWYSVWQHSVWFWFRLDFNF